MKVVSNKWLVILVASVFSGTMQSCETNTSVPENSGGPYPGLYFGVLDFIQPETTGNVYTRIQSNGLVENRQYTHDSIVWYHSIGNTNVHNDSIYYSDFKARIFSVDSSLPNLGVWEEWSASENISKPLNTVYGEIGSEHFMFKVGAISVRFNRIGNESVPWPKTKNTL